MSKQIAILIDNSGSMFHPVGGGNPDDKIVETADGAELFIQNLIDEWNANPASQFALSVHRFAASYQILPGGAQVDSSAPGFAAALGAMQASIPAITNQAASQAAVGNLTDLYDAVRRTSDYLANPANQPGFGAPDAQVIFVFSDGLQTISHNGTKTMAGYEAEQGVTFGNLLDGRGIRLVAWGVGSDALAAALRELTDQAVDPSADTEFHGPGSYTKVLAPESEGGVFANCEAIFAEAASELVSDNGILPLRPADGPASGLLWEQFSLPRRQAVPGDTPSTHVPTQLVNHKDFEVDVDGSTQVLILGLVRYSAGESRLEATSPSGATFTLGGPGTRLVQTAKAFLFKVPGPEEGTWRVRVLGDPAGRPSVMDLLARGVFPAFKLHVKATPFQIPAPGKVKVTALPRLDGKAARGRLTATALVLGGGSFTLERQDDGSFAGPVDLARPGVAPIRVEVSGKLPSGRSIRRIEFATALVGRASDPRFTLLPGTYEQGREYTVDVDLHDARFVPASRIRFGAGIEVTAFQVLSDSAARAKIRVAGDAPVGERDVVTFNPHAESLSPVRVVAARDEGQVSGRICCLRFDAAGNLVGIVLCDGRPVCVTLHDERIQKLLETARDRNLTVKVYVDARGCLTGVSICR